jgi:feruloyl esterase
MRILLALAAAGLAHAAHAADCGAALRQAQVADLKLTQAETVAAGQPWLDRTGTGREPVGAAFCRVRGVIEQEIGFELWLPEADQWNGKLLAAGVGGEAGTFNYADLARGVRRAYASASTDTGHVAEDKDWALGRPDRRANFAARANHLLAQKAKELVAAYYGNAARHAYFIGCSGGGREGMKEVQAYPGDFDGVLVGGTGPDQLAVSMRLLWSQYVAGPALPPVVDATTWRMVADAATQACDANDGVRDGVIENPAACRFEPRTLLCRPGQTAGCLDRQQVDAVTRMYAPLRDEHGRALDQGILPGVPITLAPRSEFAFSLFGKVVHGDPRWDPAGLEIARDHAAARRAWPDLPNEQADLSAFRDRGAKLIFYHGWLDPWILAQLPVSYFEQVNRRMGDTSDFFRLFMVPGMGHCAGGPGTDRFGARGDAPVADADHDMLSALEAWVERGHAPRQIIASRVEQGRVTRTRPLCPYPRQAVYRGAGSTDDAANFQCLNKDPEK